MRDLILDRMPRDPLAAEFRQGNTLGPAHRHWFRANSASNIVVYDWVNDRDTLRTTDAASDPYPHAGARQSTR